MTFSISTIIFMALIMMIISWLVRKFIYIINYSEKRRIANLEEQMIIAEIDVRNKTASFYKARTWEIIDNNTGDVFTEEEQRQVNDLGLGEYLKNETKIGDGQ